ncbi:MAG: 2-oxo acid dehydrogenase subunit E2, partial [Nanoarchaeota archaeon]|nr:2-oxo acid dehydrogenase subunit E2 [Nanoarchaeota archaeon]
IIIKKYFNIGIGVETDIGLMVPVIKNADEKSMIELAAEIAELAQKARTRTITLPEMQGSTFTITNYGSVGGTYATPILNSGESGILGTGRIFERVVPSKIGMGFAIAKILPVSFTFDHRIADGAQAARFLESLKAFLEDPDHLLLELH